MKEVLVKKQEEVAKVSEKFKSSAAVVAFKYQGLTVKRFQELRRELRAAGVEVAVIKNNISARAAKDNGYGEDFTDALTGPIALAFAKEDVVAPAKILFKQYGVEGNTLEVVKGIVDGDIYDFDQLKQLSVLPSYETLLTQLAAGMLGTVSQLAIGLNMLVEKGQEAQA
ncbi:MAG: 50S ribosomal protein L10 [Acholeplasmatales bacterium]|nr:50S ribosomal protein L10 [Acholeplasmatales bacterium]